MPKSIRSISNSLYASFITEELYIILEIKTSLDGVETILIISKLISVTLNHGAKVGYTNECVDPESINRCA